MATSATVAWPAPAGAVTTVVARGAAATCLAVAAGAHFAALIAHRGDGLPTAGFFLAVAILQLAAATAVARRASPTIRVAVVAGNLGVLALWMWSRATGLPFGSHAGVAEAVGTLDLAAAAAQVVAVAAVAFLPRTRGGAAILVGPTVGLALVAAMVAVGGARLVPLSDADHGHGGGHTSVTGHAPTPGHAPARADGAAAAHEAAAIDEAGVAAGDVPAPGEGGRGGLTDSTHHHDAGHGHRRPNPHPKVASGPS